MTSEDGNYRCSLLRSTLLGGLLGRSLFLRVRRVVIIVLTTLLESRMTANHEEIEQADDDANHTHNAVENVQTLLSRPSAENH